MEQRVVYKTSDQCVYLIKDNNIEFYLVIPNNRDISITLGLFPDVNDEVIKSFPKFNDKAIVVPVVSGQILTNANHLDMTSFKYLDSVLSYLINMAYKILSHNNLNVSNKILLNNHATYENFNNEYVKKYQGRVELYDLFPKASANQNLEVNTNVESFKPAEVPFKDNDVLDNNANQVMEPIIEDKPNINNNKEPGFVSYVLLGVLVAVLSLVFLYMLL